MNIIERIRNFRRPRNIEDASDGAIRIQIRDCETFNEAREAVRKLGNLLNGGSKEAVLAGMVEGLLMQHRYLQGETIVRLFTALGEFGGLPEGQYTDARNAFAHKLCSLLRERFRDDLFWKDA